MGAQQLVGGVVFHHGNFQPIQVLEIARPCAAFMGKNHHREVDIRASEGQVVLAFRRRHDAGDKVETIASSHFQDRPPIWRLDQLDAHAQAVLDQAYIVRR